MQPIEAVISELRCSALCLNRHFPRAVLHGPMSLGGLGIPSPKHKNTRHRINYFLYNTRGNTTVGKKYAASIVYTQLEVGTYSHFFTIPFAIYGHLATQSMAVQIWQEMSPYGIQLRPADGITWLPTPLKSTDPSLMEIAVRMYNKKGSAIINRCRIYLQLVSLYDLLLFHKVAFHPDYIQGECPRSRSSPILWPPYPRPPKRYWNLWGHFLFHHLTPLLADVSPTWHHNIVLRQSPTFFKHPSSPHLYSIIDGDVSQF